MEHVKTPVTFHKKKGGAAYLNEANGSLIAVGGPGEGYRIQFEEIVLALNSHADLLAVCVKMTNDGRFYKFNRDRVKYTCLACGGSGDSPRSIQHEKWCIINEAIAAIAKAKGDQC